MTKLLALLNDLILITQVEEVAADLGEPDCKLTNPYIVRGDQTLEPFLCGYSDENIFMINSDKILTITEPKSSILKKYEQLTK